MFFSLSKLTSACRNGSSVQVCTLTRVFLLWGVTLVCVAASLGTKNESVTIVDSLAKIFCFPSTANFILRFAAPRALAIMPGHVKAMQTRSASTTAPGTTISWCTGKSSHPVRSATSKGEMLFFNSPTVNVPLRVPAPPVFFSLGLQSHAVDEACLMQCSSDTVHKRPPLSWLNFPCSPRFLSVSCTFSPDKDRKAHKTTVHPSQAAGLQLADSLLLAPFTPLSTNVYTPGSDCSAKTAQTSSRRVLKSAMNFFGFLSKMFGMLRGSPLASAFLATFLLHFLGGRFLFPWLVSLHQFRPGASLSLKHMTPVKQLPLVPFFPPSASLEEKLQPDCALLLPCVSLVPVDAASVALYNYLSLSI